MGLCPYCKKEEVPSDGRRTCGSLKCRYMRQLEYSREYFEKYLRKTPRKVKNKEMEK